MRKLLGLLGYYRRYIQNFAKIAHPLFQLLQATSEDVTKLAHNFVLYQKQDGKMRVIGYGSRSLTKAEKNYYLHSGKLEFLALKWAVCEHFRDYLYHVPDFIVYTDNNPLTYVLTTAKLNATGHRWVSELADFSFTIKYRPGHATLMHSQDCQWILILT